MYKRAKHRVSGEVRTRRNSDASVSVLFLACALAVPALLWWDEPAYLIATAVVYIVVYIGIYRRLVYFGRRRSSRSRTREPTHVQVRQIRA